MAALDIEATISPAELRTAGMWDRGEDGYRVLDWEAVEVCLERVCELREEDARRHSRTRERRELDD